MSKSRKDRTFFDFVEHLRAGPPRGPGAEFADAIMAVVGNDPRLLQGKVPVVPYLLLNCAQGVREMIAAKLEQPRLVSDEYLRITVEDDWRVHAEVEQKPPYHLYMSVNLFLFSARLSELLISGLELDTSDEASHFPSHVESRFDPEEVGDKIRTVLDGFIQHKKIPAAEIPLGKEHGNLQLVALTSVLLYIVSHEFAHVVINESRNAGKQPPLHEFVQERMKTHFERIVRSPRHDPDDRVGLRKLDAKALREVSSRWADEINADIIAVELALEYQRKRGLWADMPEVGGYTKMGIHLGIVAQLFLQVYRNFLDSRFSMTSPTHPPLDFRMYCVQLWMYGAEFEIVVGPWTKFTQAVLKEVLAGA